MTAARNKAVMARVFERIAAGEGMGFLERLHEDVTLEISGDSSWSRRFEGRDALLIDYFGRLRQVAEDAVRLEATRLLADGDWVAAECRPLWRTRDGRDYPNRFSMWFRLEEEMIHEIGLYMDTAMAERLLGPFPAEAPPAKGC